MKYILIAFSSSQDTRESSVLQNDDVKNISCFVCLSFVIDLIKFVLGLIYKSHGNTTQQLSDKISYCHGYSFIHLVILTTKEDSDRKGSICHIDSIRI